MPVYQYKCDACDHGFEQYQTLKEDTLRRCPKCRKYKLYRVICAPMLVQNGEPKTLGMLAERNASKMSDEEKRRISKEQETKRDEVLYKRLPKGMRRLKKPKNCCVPDYKKGQTVSTREIMKMTEAQKKKFIETGRK